MAAEHDANELRLSSDQVAQAQAEIEAGPLPVEPAEPAAEGIGYVVAAVGGCRERDQRVGMQVIDMGRGKKAVEWRVDRRHRAARAEARVVEQRDHLVLPVEPFVDALHGAQPFEVDKGETIGSQRAEVSAGPLHGEHGARLTRDRVLEIDLRGRVAAAEVRDAWVGTEPA